MYNWKDKVFDGYSLSFNECDHKNEDGTSAYEETYSDYEQETYVCKKCGDRYKLYYDDMK